MRTMWDAGKALGVSQPTLRRYVTLLGIERHHDPYDAHLRLLDDEQIARLREALEPMQRRKKVGPAR